VSLKQAVANGLVYGIVSANILSDENQCSGRIEQPGRVEPASATKYSLCRSENRWHPQQELRFDPEGRVRSWCLAYTHSVN
jgi:hypothetical protein